MLALAVSSSKFEGRNSQIPVCDTLSQVSLPLCGYFVSGCRQIFRSNYGWLQQSVSKQSSGEYSNHSQLVGNNCFSLGTSGCQEVTNQSLGTRWRTPWSFWMNKQMGLTNIIKLMVMRTKLAASLSSMDWASFLAQKCFGHHTIPGLHGTSHYQWESQSVSPLSFSTT